MFGKPRVADSICSWQFPRMNDVFTQFIFGTYLKHLAAQEVLFNRKQSAINKLVGWLLHGISERDFKDTYLAISDSCRRPSLLASNTWS